MTVAGSRHRRQSQSELSSRNAVMLSNRGRTSSRSPSCSRITSEDGATEGQTRTSGHLKRTLGQATGRYLLGGSDRQHERRWEGALLAASQQRRERLTIRNVERGLLRLPSR